VLNPLIIGTVPDADGQVLGIERVAAVTALVAAVMTILMGVVGKYPFAIATGLGLNAFVTFSVASQMSWEEAMGLVVSRASSSRSCPAACARPSSTPSRCSSRPPSASASACSSRSSASSTPASSGASPDAAGTTVPLQLGPSGQLQGWPTVVFVFGSC
jgi:AGZA family xanthine/uracil permease-like MFS transporter